jgi:hypothetical protein
MLICFIIKSIPFNTSKNNYFNKNLYIKYQKHLIYFFILFLLILIIINLNGINYIKIINSRQNNNE